MTFDNILPHFKDFERPQFHSNKNICISAGKDCPIGNVEYAIFGKSFMVHETATVKLTSFGTNSKISMFFNLIYISFKVNNLNLFS